MDLREGMNMISQGSPEPLGKIAKGAEEVILNSMENGKRAWLLAWYPRLASGSVQDSAWIFGLGRCDDHARDSGEALERRCQTQLVEQGDDACRE